MDLKHFDPLATSLRSGLSRRAALGRLGAGGIAAALLATAGLRRSAAAQDATTMVVPAGWRAEHLEVDVVPVDPVSITVAGGGPPQRGDFFSISGPIFAAGDVNGTEIGVYQCFGVWTHAADDTAAIDLRLTTVQFRFADGAFMGLINEFGTEGQNHIGAVQGGTGKYTAALGTFVQMFSVAPGVATPEAETTPGTPAAGQGVVRAVIDLLLPAA